MSRPARCAKPDSQRAPGKCDCIKSVITARPEQPSNPEQHTTSKRGRGCAPVHPPVPPAYPGSAGPPSDNSPRNNATTRSNLLLPCGYIHFFQLFCTLCAFFSRFLHFLQTQTTHECKSLVLVIRRRTTCVNVNHRYSSSDAKKSS